MGISDIFSTDKLREEAKEELRRELERDIAETKKMAEEEAEGIIYLARQEANNIIQNAKEEADKIRQKEMQKMQEAWEKINILATELARKINDIKHLKKIVREKNLVNLRNLARSVPPARVKRELIRANKQLILLSDLDEEMQNLINSIDSAKKQD